jgi:hypothetical protein
LPYVRIAERLGVAKSTLANWSAKLEAEIATARAMELEALQAEFFVLKEGRITLLGEQLQRLRGELASRDLGSSQVETAQELLRPQVVVVEDLAAAPGEVQLDPGIRGTIDDTLGGNRLPPRTA